MDRANYFKANNGRPHNVVMTRPLPAEHHPAPIAAPVKAASMAASTGTRAPCTGTLCKETRPGGSAPGAGDATRCSSELPAQPAPARTA